jgi:hypothetical protein
MSNTVTPSTVPQKPPATVQGLRKNGSHPAQQPLQCNAQSGLRRDRETMARPQIRFPTESRSVIVRQTHRREEVPHSYKGEGEGAEGYEGS